MRQGRRRLRTCAIAATAIAGALLFGGAPSAAPGDIHQVSNGSFSAAGTQVEVDQEGASISANGRRVSFYTTNGLVPADPSFGTFDDYVYDLDTGTDTLVSADVNGVRGNASSEYTAISGDGSKVAFDSLASNFGFVDPQPNRWNVYVKDLTTGAVALASTADGTTPIGGRFPSISADGTRVAFIAGDNGPIWVRDLAAGTLTQVTTDSHADAPAISPDGTKVAFSTNTALLPADTNTIGDVYVFDLTSSTLTLASTDAAGLPSSGGLLPGSDLPALSGDGRDVVFQSYASLGTSDDSAFDSDIFRKDLVTGAITLVTNGAGGAPTTGRYPTISSDGTKVAYDDTPGNTSGGAWVADLTTGTTQLTSLDATNTPINAQQPSALSLDGKSIVFGHQGIFFVKELLPFGGFVDTDGDGIDNAIDIGSAAFSDGTTTGSIVDAAGLTIQVTDAPAPDGVHITVHGTGSSDAVFSACGFGAIHVTPGSDVILTCGSVKLKVATGVARVVLGSGITTVSIPAGATAEVTDRGSGSFSVSDSASSTAAVTVTTNGVVTTLSAGATSTLAVVTIGNVCGLTKLDIQGSARYRALTAKQRATVDALANAACSVLQTITPKLNAKQKAAVLATYVVALKALVQPGWLTQAQADTLKALAATL